MFSIPLKTQKKIQKEFSGNAPLEIDGMFNIFIKVVICMCVQGSMSYKPIFNETICAVFYIHFHFAMNHFSDLENVPNQ